MKTFDRRSTALALALFALVGSMVMLAPATAEASHPQKKGVIESRGARELLKRLDRAGHDHRVLDQRFFHDLERAGRRSREWRIFGQLLLSGRFDWYGAETSRYWVRANYPNHYAAHMATLAPRVFVRVRGAPKLGEAVRYELMQSYGRRGVIFVNRPGRADLVVEVDGLISGPLFSAAGSRSKTVKFPKRYRRTAGATQLLYARYDRVRERVRIEYDLQLSVRSGGRVFDRVRARGYVSEVIISAHNYRVVTAAGLVAREVFPSRKIERLYRNAQAQGRLQGAASLQNRLVHALAHEVRDLRFPSRFQFRRVQRIGARYAIVPGAARGKGRRARH